MNYKLTSRIITGPDGTPIAIRRARPSDLTAGTSVVHTEDNLTFIRGVIETIDETGTAIVLFEDKDVEALHFMALWVSDDYRVITKDEFDELHNVVKQLVKITTCEDLEQLDIEIQSLMLEIKPLIEK